MSSETAAPSAMRYGNFQVLCDQEGKPRLLGRGTFGSTWFAQHRFLETHAALKVINERFAAEASARERFLREGRALARLDHRFIARLQDFGEAGGSLFYAMEYCEGGDLAERVRSSGALSVADWLLVAQQVASALVCCHASGFIHRDLKPSNIMLARRQGPLALKLIDFGLVHAERKAALSGHETIPGARFIGTPLYASPEQLREEPVDARSDLFAFGMTLWHLASGAAPESGPSPKLITSRLSFESYEPQLPSHLPAPLRSILATLVEKEPDQRPTSAAAVLAALDEAARTLGLPQLHEVVGAAEKSGALPEGALPSLLPAPQEVVEVASTLETEFTVLHQEGEQSTGINYLAERKIAPGGRVWLHSLHPQLVRDTGLFTKIRTALSALREFAIADVLAPEGLRSYDNFTVAVLRAPSGVSLLHELKSRGVLALSDLRELLARVAQASDQLVVAGLPGIELNAASIFIQPGPEGLGAASPVEFVPRFLPALEAAPLTASSVLDDTAATMAPDFFEDSAASDRPAVQFARLIFRMTAGRECPGAASVSVSGYVAVPGLSEDANRLLAQVIAGTSQERTCAGLLNNLLAAEGLGGPPRTGSSARPPSTARPDTRVSPRIPLHRPGAPTAPPAPAPHAAPPPAPAPPEPRPFPTPPPAKAPPALQREQRRRVVVRVVITVCLLALFGVWLARREPGTESNGGGKTSGGTPAPISGATLPANAVATFVGDLPGHAEFTVAGRKVQAERQKGNWVIAAGSLPLPLEVAFHARGYQSVTKRIERADQLNDPTLVALERSKGMLIIRATGPADYTNALLKMNEALPEESGLVPVERVDFGSEITPGTDNRVELATGKYSIILRGSSARTVTPRELKRLEIRAGTETVCVVPQSCVGQWVGELRDAAGAGQAELRIEQGFAVGEFSDQRDGTQRRARLERCRLDANGALTSVAKFSELASPVCYDEQLKARLTEDGQLELEITEDASENASIQSAIGRPPFRVEEWTRRGTLRRMGP